MKRWKTVPVQVLVMIFLIGLAVCGNPRTAAGETALEEFSMLADSAGTTGELLEIYDSAARQHAQELETGGWEIDLDNGIREDFPEALLPPEKLNKAVTDELPAEILKRKYIVLYRNETYDITVLLGSYMTRLPAENRAASVEEADVVLLLRESLTPRTDYIGSASDRHYGFYIWETGGKKIWKIAERVTNPPLSGKGILTGAEIPRSELWYDVRDIFYSTVFDMVDGNGTVMTFRPVGEFTCVLAGADPAENETLLDIPQEANGLAVIEIEKECLRNNKSVETIIIPHGVKRISGHAFSGCSALKQAILPDTLEIIGEYAFSDCHQLREAEIPDSVREIGMNSFSGCSDLESFRIPAAIRREKSDPGLSEGRLARVVVSEGVTELDTVPDGPALACCYLPASLRYIDRIVNNDMYCTVFYAPSGSYAMSWLTEHGIEYVACERPEDMPQPEYIIEDGLEFRLFNGEAALYSCGGKAESFTIPETAGGYPVTRILGYSLVCGGERNSAVIPGSVRLISDYAIPYRKQLSVSDLYITSPETELKPVCDKAVIHAPEGSLAQQSAEKNGNAFEIWDGETN